MLTGDARREAEAVAAEAGIQEVRAELLPQDKLKEMNDLRNKFGGVMFVGDGINDAPVLAGADVGAAMGSGADAAIEAADVVFMNSEMSAIPKAIAIAKAVNNVAWQNCQGHHHGGRPLRLRIHVGRGIRGYRRIRAVRTERLPRAV